MLARLRVLLLLPIATLIACGGNSLPPTGTSYTPVSGDYVITVGVGTVGAGTFSGNLLVAGTAVSGVFRYSNPSVCVSSGQDIPFSGVFQSNVLTLTSASFSSNVATLTIHLPFSNNSVNQQLASGTAVITGGACALASSALQAQFIPSYSGTWTVTLTSPSAANGSLVVAQSTIANADGEFSATGTLSFNPAGCTSAPPDITYTGLVSGASLQLKSSQYGTTISANSSGTPATVSIGGDINGSPQSSCMTTYNGTMTQ